MLANEDLGRKIIADVKRLSAPFGTRVEYRDGVGTVILDAAVQESLASAPSTVSR